MSSCQLCKWVFTKSASKYSIRKFEEALPILGISVTNNDSTICKSCARRIPKMIEDFALLDKWQQNQQPITNAKRLLSPSSAMTPTRGQRKRPRTDTISEESVDFEKYVTIESSDLKVFYIKVMLMC